MKSRVSFIAITALLGLVLWWILSISQPRGPANRTSAPPDSPAHGSSVNARGHPGAAPSAPGSPAESPRVPEHREPGLDPVDPIGDAARVTPPPRTIKIGAVEEPPRGPAGGAAPTGVPGAVPAGAVDEDGAPVPELPPVTVLENYRGAFRQYASRYGGNPVGDNAEITAALLGGNPRQATFLRATDGLRVNAEGQAMDAWGTPYFFHQLSRTEMEIRSAGPDRRMWTTDDLVLK